MTGIVLHVAPGAALTATVDAGQVDLRPKERVVAATLAMHHPNPVTLSQLIALVWPNDAPATAKQSIHNHLARLRTAVPGLVESTVAGYVLGNDVSIVVVDAGTAHADTADTDYLIEFADLPEVRRPRAEFVRRHVSARHPDPTETMRNGGAPDLIEPLEEAVRHEPGDERSWWLLAIATTRVDGIASGGAVVERARRALRDVGLGLGRRLLDLDGMLRDGVDDVHVLLRDPYGSSGDTAVDPVDDHITACLADVRAMWSEHERFLVCVRGPDDALRRAVLARIIDDGRASGFSTAFARHLPGDVGPPTLRSTHRGTRPIVMVVDGFDRSDDPVTLARRVAGRLPSEAVGWVVAESPGAEIGATLRLTGLDDTTPTHVVDVPTPADVDGRSEGRSPLGRVTPGTLHLIRLLAAVGEPIVPEHLTRIAPGAAAAALDAARAGLARVDAATHTIDLTSNTIATAALDGLDDVGRRSMAVDLLSLELPALDDARRRELRSRWSIEAYGADDDRTMNSTIEAADAFGLRGEYDAAAAVIRRTLEPIAAAHGRSARWCRLAIHAGRAMLAGGDTTGDAVLAEVVAAASDIGDDALAAEATHEWCRLGTAAGAGSVDDVRLQVTSELLARLTAPADRARVGAAAAMVLSLAGEPELLRARFVGAMHDATASNDPAVMSEVLPLSYMSMPLHSDIEARTAHAETLLQLASALDRPDSRWEALQIRYSTELMRGDPAFRATFAELCDVVSQLHERSRVWEMHYIRSNMAIIDGDLERARREVDESLAFGGQINDERVSAVFGAHHLIAAMVDGTAADLLEALRDLASDQPGIGAWQAAHAVAAAAAGERDEAVDALRRVIDHDDVNLPRDPVYSAGLVAFGEAATATGDSASLTIADALLEPLTGMWSWCGSCTFGPIDLTRARVALSLDDPARAAQIAADAVVTCAEMRAPVFARQAIDLLLATSTSTSNPTSTSTSISGS